MSPLLCVLLVSMCQVALMAPVDVEAKNLEPLASGLSKVSSSNNALLQQTRRGMEHLGFNQMKSDLNAVYKDMSEIEMAAHKAVQGKIHLSKPGLENAAEMIQSTEGKEHAVDRDGNAVEKNLKGILSKLSAAGAVPSAQQHKRNPHLSEEMLVRDAQSRLASRMVDALTDVSTKLEKGLEKHTDAELSAKMEEQVQSLEGSVNQEDAAQVMKNIRKEAVELLDMEKAGNAFVDQAVEELKKSAKP